MATLSLFVTIIAWVSLVGALLVTGLRIYGATQYTALHKALDDFKGISRSFPLGKPLLIAIVCAAWLIASYATK